MFTKLPPIPSVVLVPSPELKDTVPPRVDTELVVPAYITKAPPSNIVPGRSVTIASPPFPLFASPLFNIIIPDAPELLVPVVNTIAPLPPASPAFSERIITVPLVVDIPTPGIIVTSPPVKLSVMEPAIIFTSPPTVQLDPPPVSTDNCILPAFPPVAAPV